MEIKTKVLLSAAIVVIVIIVTYLHFYPKSPITEILKLNPDEGTLNAINMRECSNLIKTEDYWLVNGCKGDVYFKLFLTEDGYYLGYCSSWQTPREAFLKFTDLWPTRECVVTSEDKFVREVDSYKMYEVCGFRVVFKDNCIIGVGRL